MRFLSQVYTIARGSVGGITYTANQWHQLIARARTAPVQPGTPFQTGIRSTFDASDEEWRGLTDQQRTDWSDYAATCIYPGPLGNYAVPGRQLMIGTLALVKYASAYDPLAGIIEVLTAPVIAGWFNPGIIQVGLYNGETQGFAVSIQNPGDEGCIAVIDSSIAFNSSRLRYKGPWKTSRKVVFPIDPTTSVSVDIDTAVGTLGQIVFSRMRLFTSAVAANGTTPHRLAALFYLRHTVEEPPPPNGPVGGLKSAGKKVKKAKTSH